MAYDNEEKTDNRMKPRYKAKGRRVSNQFISSGHTKASRSTNLGRGTSSGPIARKPSSIQKELAMREAEWLAKMTALLTPSAHALMPGGQTSYNPSQGMPGYNPTGGPPLWNPNSPLFNLPQPQHPKKRGRWWDSMA